MLPHSVLKRFKPAHRDAVQTYWSLMLQFPDDLFDSETGRLVQFACNLGEAIGWCRQDLGHFADALLDTTITKAAAGRRERFAVLAAVVRNMCTTAKILIDLFAAVDVSPTDCELSPEELAAVSLTGEIKYLGESPRPMTFSDWVKCIGDEDPFIVDEASRIAAIIASKRFDLGSHRARMNAYREALKKTAADASTVARRIKLEYSATSGNTEDPQHRARMRDAAEQAETAANVIAASVERIGAEYAVGFEDSC